MSQRANNVIRRVYIFFIYYNHITFPQNCYVRGNSLVFLFSAMSQTTNAMRHIYTHTPKLLIQTPSRPLYHENELVTEDEIPHIITFRCSSNQITTQMEHHVHIIYESKTRPFLEPKSRNKLHARVKKPVKSTTRMTRNLFHMGSFERTGLLSEIVGLGKRSRERNVEIRIQGTPICIYV
jgi:hypothetical protein